MPRHMMRIGGPIDDAVLRHQAECRPKQLLTDGDQPRMRRQRQEVIVVSDQAARDLAIVDAGQRRLAADLAHLAVVDLIDFARICSISLSERLLSMKVYPMVQICSTAESSSS